MSIVNSSMIEELEKIKKQRIGGGNEKQNDISEDPLISNDRVNRDNPFKMEFWYLNLQVHLFPLDRAILFSC